jgi:hypothetical protein
MPGRLELLLLVGAIALAGCGDVPGGSGNAGDDSPPPATAPPETGFSETSESAPATTSAEPSPPAPEIHLPGIVFDSAAGRQKAVLESHCVQGTDSAGTSVGICGDTPDLDPKRLSIVHAGEAVTISVPGATLSGGSSISIRPLGCHDRQVASVPLETEGVTWTVDLPPAAYELQVFVLFETGEVSGDSAGSLGLLVDPSREPAIIRARPRFFVCSPSEQG